MKGIKKEKFYHIRYIDGTTDIIVTDKSLKIGRYYRFKDNREARIVKQGHYKYTFEDIDTIRKLTEDYNIGTLQYRLSQKMDIALSSKIPSVRFTDEERKMLSYIYYDNEYLTDKDKEVLEKILDIK